MRKKAKIKVEYDPGIKIECSRFLGCKRKSKITSKGKLPRGWKHVFPFFLCPKHKKLKAGARRELLDKAMPITKKKLKRRK